MNQNVNNIWRGTLVLTVAALMVKVLSAVYRLPYQNLAGDVGLYVYQQVYPFYALAVAMGGTSFPIIISKLMAERGFGQNRHSRPYLFMNAWYALTILSVLGFVLLFFGAPWIARFMSDIKLVTALRTIAFIYLFVPFLGTLRGFFQGNAHNMSPTAISQIGEQALRVTTIIGLALFLFYHGGNPYQFGNAAAFGSMIGPVASLAILLLFFVKHNSGSTQKMWYYAPIDGSLIWKLIKNGLAFTFLSLTLVSMQFIDSMSIVTMLDHGHFENAKALKGIYDRAYPMIQMGMTAALALTTAIVPVIAEARQANNDESFRQQTRMALLLSFMLGTAASVGLFIIGKEINHMLFKDLNGSLSLMTMGINIITVSLIVTSAGIWQGTGRDQIAVRYLLLTIGIKVLLNILLIPVMGIEGAALSTVFATGIGSFINLFHLQRSFDIKLIRYSQLMKLTVALVLLIGVTDGWKQICYTFLGMALSSRSQSAIVALTSVGFGAVAFFCVIVISKFFNHQERTQLPFQQVGKWLKKSS